MKALEHLNNRPIHGVGGRDYYTTQDLKVRYMSGRDKKNERTLTLVDAVETLSNIADLQIDQVVDVEEPEVFAADMPVKHRAIHWLHQREATETINIVKDTFCAILKYLKDFYKKSSFDSTDPNALEGIKTVMVLVGEAAKKLDKCTAVFFKNKKDSVTELKEYKRLQEFYLKQITRKIDEEKLGEWIFGLSHKRIIFHKTAKLKALKAIQARHVFIDFDSVKNDTEYELFLLRKEDGTRFYSPRLVRNIKLISNFGNLLSNPAQVDPLLNIGIWESRYANHLANAIIKSSGKEIEQYFSLMVQEESRAFVETLNKAIIALFMAAKIQNLVHDDSLKDCKDYFRDFQVFVRECLSSNDYHKLMAYPREDDLLSTLVVKIIRTFCSTMYSGLIYPHELTGMVQGLLQESESKHLHDQKNALPSLASIGARLGAEYQALSKFIKQHPSGTMNKILNTLEDGTDNSFDPLMQGNLPSMLYAIYVHDKVIPVGRWPSVTRQQFIDKAALNEEFKAFLNDCLDQRRKVLLINFQDRVSWRERARTEAIEDLAKSDLTKNIIDVVTFSKDTEFYRQLSPYTNENHRDVFIANFKRQLESEAGGYLFGGNLALSLRKFYGPCMEEICKIFFSNKNVLTCEDRLNFIEIFYLFLMLKVIDLVKPDIIGLSCKDALDVTSAVATELYVFMKLLSQEQLSENDREFIDLMIYCPCLLTRERILNPDRLNRMVSVLKVIESVRSQYGHLAFSKIIEQGFGRFYHLPIFTGKVVNL